MQQRADPPYTAERGPGNKARVLDDREFSLLEEIKGDLLAGFQGSEKCSVSQRL